MGPLFSDQTAMLEVQHALVGVALQDQAVVVQHDLEVVALDDLLVVGGILDLVHALAEVVHHEGPSYHEAWMVLYHHAEVVKDLLDHAVEVVLYSCLCHLE